MDRLKNLIYRLYQQDERGVTTAEYAVMLVLVAIAVAAFGPGLSNSITGVFQDLIDVLTPAP